MDNVSHRLNIVLFQPEIAYNTGSVGRTSVALGAKLWLVRPLGFVIDDKRLRRAGMDYWKDLDYEIVADWDELLKKVGDRNFWFFTKTAKRSYLDARFTGHDVLVFGSESAGLPQSLLQEHGEQCLKIPISAKARSLNLSVSVAVATFEAQRQIGL